MLGLAEDVGVGSRVQGWMGEVLPNFLYHMPLEVQHFRDLSWSEATNGATFLEKASPHFGACRPGQLKLENTASSQFLERRAVC